MAFYVQYDEEGNITGTVLGDLAPIFGRQLQFVDYVDTGNKRVNTETLELEDQPPAEEE